MNDKIEIPFVSYWTMILFALFFIAKIFDKIDWSWWIVFAPLWIPFSVVFILIFLIFIAKIFLCKL